jgi:hypothetical protein
MSPWQDETILRWHNHVPSIIDGVLRPEYAYIKTSIYLG